MRDRRRIFNPTNFSRTNLEWASTGIGSGEVTPAPFSHTLGVEILRYSKNNAVIRGDYTASFPAIVNKRYVDAINGSDLNDGLTEITAYKKIRTALVELEGLGSCAEVELVSEYGYEDELGSYIWTIPLKISAKTTARLGYNYGDSYQTLHSNGVYKNGTAISKDIYSFIDYSKLDSEGFPELLKTVSTLAECESTPSTYYEDGTTKYIHLHDGRVPDEYVVARKRTYFTPTDYFWMKDTDLCSTNVFSCSGVTIFENCGFYGVTGYTTGSKSYTISSKIAYQDGDQIIHNGSGDHLEFNCVVKYNQNESTVSVNCTTGHDTVNVIHVGCKYYTSDGVDRTVHYIGNGNSWFVNCYSECGLRVPDEYGNPAFAIGSLTATSSIRNAWFDNCTASGSGFWFGNYASGEMYFRDSRPDGATYYNDDDGQIYNATVTEFIINPINSDAIQNELYMRMLNLPSFASGSQIGNDDNSSQIDVTKTVTLTSEYQRILAFNITNISTIDIPRIASCNTASQFNVILQSDGCIRVQGNGLPITLLTPPDVISTSGSYDIEIWAKTDSLQCSINGVFCDETPVTFTETSWASTTYYDQGSIAYTTYTTGFGVLTEDWDFALKSLVGSEGTTAVLTDPSGTFFDYWLRYSDNSIVPAPLIYPNPTNYAGLTPLVGDNTASYDQAGWVALNDWIQTMISENGMRVLIYNTEQTYTDLTRGLQWIGRGDNYVLSDGELVFFDGEPVVA